MKFMNGLRPHVRSAWIVTLGLALLVPVTASARPESNDDKATEGRRKGLFPARNKKKAEEPKKEESEEVAADPAGAQELPADGIWEWVGEMQGEIPTEEQVAAIRETQAAERAEKNLFDDLTGAEAPLAFYTDPSEALQTDPLYLDMINPDEFDIPIEVNDSVVKWMQYFTGNGRKHYARWLSRSTRYRPMMYRELEEAGLPRDLVYLSMIESGYNAHAYSHAAAAGLWQFIPSTGKLYDLRVDWWVDDRRDPEKSVGAAIRFLGELNKMFDGDWRIAWASYNAGPGRLRRAIRNSGSKDFWTIQKGPYLHSETDNYVPKIMAAAIIGHHPERYGFTDIDFQEELVYEVQKVEGSVELEVIAKAAGTDLDTIKSLNPGLRRYATPSEGYDVRVPVGKGETFAANLAKIPKSQRLTTVHHTVRKGDTLGTIATRYGSSVSAISSSNRLKNANRIYVGMSLVIPRNGHVAPSSVATVSKSTRTDARPTVSSHTVRRGETLSGIAAKYGTTTGSLQRLNGMGSSKILVGQKLKVSGTASRSSSSKQVTHVVRSGESLGKIAARYGVSASQVQSWNGIRNASHITVGQRLKIHANGGTSTSSSFTTYTVQRGDSLGKIANRYGCSVSELKSWNKLSTTTIQPGQKLKVKRK